MDINSVIDSLKRKTIDVVYISDKGKNTCATCSVNDGKVFNIDDPDLPYLPIHPHCRCRYAPVASRTQNVNEEVEKNRFSKNAMNLHSLSAEDAEKFAEQVIAARHNNQYIREQKNFVIFNGRYLFSNDGKLFLDAVSGQPISADMYSKFMRLELFERKITKFFNYSYERQGLRDIGGIPQGLYFIYKTEERSSKTSPYSHTIKYPGWGKYAWSLHPAEETDVRERSGFFIHGGTRWGSAGCIDLRDKDTVFREYFTNMDVNKLSVYVHYQKENVFIKEKNLFTSLLQPILLESYLR